MPDNDFRYFRTPLGPSYYRLDPDAAPGTQIRHSRDGRWEKTDLTLAELVDDLDAAEVPVDEVPCHLCMVAAGTVTRQLVADLGDAVIVVPRSGGVCDGHLLVIPKVHVTDALEDPELTALVTGLAARYAKEHMGGSLNIATSVGRPATQTERHLHVHLTPREFGDGLPFLWDTGGLVAVPPGHLLVAEEWLRRKVELADRIVAVATTQLGDLSRHLDTLLSENAARQVIQAEVQR